MMQRIAQPAGRKAAMPFIMATVLIDMVSIGLIIPVLAPLIGTFTASQSEQAFWYGAITIAFGVANFFGSPVLGRLSDRYGRRPVLLIGFSGLALSFFVTGMAPPPQVLQVQAWLTAQAMRFRLRRDAVFAGLRPRAVAHATGEPAPGGAVAPTIAPPLPSVPPPVPR